MGQIYTGAAPAGALYSITRDWIADQSTSLLLKDDTLALPTFHATEGLGVATAASRYAIFPIGGGDQRITCTMKYTAPGTPTDHELGPILRRNNDDRNYYWARLDDGNARITRVLDDAFVTLTESAYIVPVDEIVTVTFQIIGPELQCTWSAPTPGDLTLTASDASIGEGCMGWRTRTSTGYLRTSKLEVL